MEYVGGLVETSFVSPYHQPDRKSIQDSEQPNPNEIFEEFGGTGNSTTDKLWTYFLRKRSGESAKCKTCQKILSCSGGSISGLKSHLKRVHQIT